MIRRPPRSTPLYSSAASDVYKRQDGIVMAGNGTFHIQVNGKGGHSSQPELCLDPVLAASAIVVALQQVVSRRIAPQKIAVVSVTYMEAPSGETTIPDVACLLY